MNRVDPSGMVDCPVNTFADSSGCFAASGSDGSGARYYVDGTCGGPCPTTGSGDGWVNAGITIVCGVTANCTESVDVTPVDAAQDVSAGSAPVDPASSTIAVVVDESTNSPGPEPSTAGGSTVGRITPPNTGDGGLGAAACLTCIIAGEAQQLGTNGCTYDADGYQHCDLRHKLGSCDAGKLVEAGAAAIAMIVTIGIGGVAITEGVETVAGATGLGELVHGLDLIAVGGSISGPGGGATGYAAVTAAGESGCI